MTRGGKKSKEYKKVDDWLNRLCSKVTLTADNQRIVSRCHNSIVDLMCVLRSYAQSEVLSFSLSLSISLSLSFRFVYLFLSISLIFTLHPAVGPPYLLHIGKSHGEQRREPKDHILHVRWITCHYVTTFQIQHDRYGQCTMAQRFAIKSISFISHHLVIGCTTEQERWNKWVATRLQGDRTSARQGIPQEGEEENKIIYKT